MKKDTLDEAFVSEVAAAQENPEPDTLILVDPYDRDVGRLGKARCHEGKGVLHRAFSLLIFNGDGELLIQQRAPAKRLWPLYWSNSCCSHPRGGESMEAATQRRLREELGIACPLQFLFKFQYHAQFDATGSEHELCSVFIGRTADPIKADPSEILAWRWVAPDALQAQLSAGPPTPGPGAAVAAAGESIRFTPWFQMEWARIWRDHRDAVDGLNDINLSSTSRLSR